MITSVYQPFNPKSFNFTWIKSSEVIFNLRKSHSPSTNGVSNGEEVSEPVNGAVSEVCFTFFYLIPCVFHPPMLESVFFIFAGGFN